MLTKVKHHSLVDDVVNQIEESILARDYQAGDKLPSSRELQSIMGASLGTIREAVAILEQKGLVEVKKGAKGGIFVKEPSTKPMSDNLTLLIRQRKISPAALSEFRQTVEAGLVRLVTQRASDEELDGLKKYRLEMEKCLGRGPEGWEKFLETESKLRKQLIKYARNRIYEAVLLPIHNNIFAYAILLLPGNNELIQEAYEDWVALLSALAARDAEKAAQLTSDHIVHFQAHLEQGSLAKKKNPASTII